LGNRRRWHAGKGAVMATVQTPDGSTISIPDGLSGDQVHAILIARRQQQDQLDAENEASYAREKFDALPAWKKIGLGLAQPVERTYLGVKGLVTDLSPQDKGDLALLRAPHGGAAATGNIAGNVALMAAPGGVAGKVASTATRFPRVVAALANLGSNSGMAALQAPEPGSSRLQNATIGGSGSVLGSAAAPVLRATLLGMKPVTDRASRFLADNVPLTPGQFGGSLAQWVEGKLAGIPGIGGMVRARQNEAIDAAKAGYKQDLSAWNKDTLGGVVPGGSVSASGQQGFKEAHSLFNDAYSALKNAIPNGEAIHATDEQLRKRGLALLRAGDYDGAQAVFAKRDQLKAALPPEYAQEWSNLDSLYNKFLTVRKAATTVAASKAGQEFTPDQLLSAAVVRGSKSKVAMGAAPLQQEATAARQTFLNKAADIDSLNVPDGLSNAEQFGVGYGLLRAPGAALLAPVAAAAYSKPGMAWLTGQTALQRAVKPRAQDFIKALHDYVTPGQFGTAVADENQ
jgi:hypothetical protein